ncbi:MAG: DoxX family protein [Bdellovibrionia bacterium]
MRDQIQKGVEFLKEDVSKLLLRLGTGGMMLPHGIAKLTAGLEFIRTSLTQVGLPEFLAPAVFIGELVAPLGLILGFGTRISGLILATNMVFTLFLAHRDSLFKLNEYGGWDIELNVFYLICGLVLALIGGGRIAVKRSGLLS